MLTDFLGEKDSCIHCYKTEGEIPVHTHDDACAADFSLLNLPKGKSLGRIKPTTSSYAQAPQHTVWDDFYYI